MSQMALAAGAVFDGTQLISDGVLLVAADGHLTALPRAALPATVPVVEHGPDALVTPGFIDAQVNGGGGVLLNDDPSPAAMAAVAAAHRASGTGALLATVITDTPAVMVAALQAAAARPPGVVGVHLEGPYLNRQRAGAHRADLIREAASDPLEWLSWVPAAGRVVMTLAPECVPPGFIQRLVQAGVIVAAGHSAADAATLSRAVAEGLSLVTHLFNAMPPMSAREPGLAGAALGEPRLGCGLIADGYHVAPEMLRLALAAKGAEGLFLVSDAMPSVGSDIQHFTLAGRAVTRQGDRLVTQEGTLAGAHLTLAMAVRTMITAAKAAPEVALQLATTSPARWLRLPLPPPVVIPRAAVGV